MDERRQVSCSGLVTREGREGGRRPRRVRERIGVAATHGSAGRHLPDATWGSFMMSRQSSAVVNGLALTFVPLASEGHVLTSLCIIYVSGLFQHSA